jgi:hypothetical protein
VSKATPRIQVTKNYKLFGKSIDNRDVDLKGRRDLEESMKQYGFLRCYAIVCGRDKDKNLYVKDGQHRLATAIKLGLEVCWIEDTSDMDVATVNSTQRQWKTKDYAWKYANKGNQHYKEVLQFVAEHRISISLAARLLSGTQASGNFSRKFRNGEFKVKDRDFAHRVVSIYVPSIKASKNLRNRYYLLACSKAAMGAAFSVKRFTDSLAKHRELLVNFGSADAYMDMMENVYNFGRRDLFPLKIEAIKAMRDRTPSGPKGGGSRNGVVASA